MPSLIIDSFAGGGGASTGIEMALGRSPDYAINHNPKALALHEANHPDTIHLSNDIWAVDPYEVARGRPVGLLWASPDCKHFSKAKGGAPRDRNIRDLAWVIVDWAEKVKPDVIAMENVEEFVTWGPLGEDGQPMREFAGQTFELWVKRLRRAGYRIQWRELRACDYGAPTIRKRFFMVARRDGRPIIWPRPTHGDPKSPAVKRGHRLPWRTAAEIIDWSLPCPSIFDTTAQIRATHDLAAKRPLAPNTMARIARGIRRYVLDAEQPFLISLKGTDRRDRSVDSPHPTVLAGGGNSAVVAPSITRFNGGATGRRMDEPLATVTANSFLKRPGGAAPLGLIAPTMVQVGYGERAGQAARALDLTQPLGTVVAGGAKHAPIAATLAPWITYGQHKGMNRDALDPLHTVTASKKDTNCAAAVYLAQHNNDSRRTGGVNPGRTVDAPAATVTTTGSQITPVAAWFAKYYGTGDGAPVGAPCHTITVRDRLGIMQAETAIPPFSEEHAARAREIAAFLRAHDAWDDREFVTLEVGGETFVIIDIGMRMLTPRELFRAQGFPDDYVIEGVWRDDGGAWTWHPFTKDVQVGCAGNSVCPPLAEAIVRSNCAHLSAEEMEATA